MQIRYERYRERCLRGLDESIASNDVIFFNLSLDSAKRLEAITRLVDDAYRTNAELKRELFPLARVRKQMICGEFL